VRDSPAIADDFDGRQEAADHQPARNLGKSAPDDERAGPGAGEEQDDRRKADEAEHTPSPPRFHVLTVHNVTAPASPACRCVRRRPQANGIALK